MLSFAFWLLAWVRAWLFCLKSELADQRWFDGRMLANGTGALGGISRITISRNPGDLDNLGSSGRVQTGQPRVREDYARLHKAQHRTAPTNHYFAQKQWVLLRLKSTKPAIFSVTYTFCCY